MYVLYVVGGGVMETLYRFANDNYLSRMNRKEVSVENVICMDCSYVGQHPLIDPDVLSEMYKDSYREGDTVPEEYLKIHNKNVVEKSKYLDNLLQSKRGGRLLEIGSAAGLLINEIKKYGYDVYGIEPTEKYAKYSVEKLGLNVKTGLFKKGLYPEKNFDVILLIQTLEHIPDPKSTLINIYDNLKEDGLFYVEVPNVLAYDNLGWFAAPHVSSFSLNVLRHLLELSSFSVVFIEENKWGISALCKKGRANARIEYNVKENVRKIKFHIMFLKLKAKVESLIRKLRLIGLAKRIKSVLGRR